MHVAGTVIVVRYRGNAQAKRIIMRMERDGRGIVLTVPPGTSAAKAYEFACDQCDWIAQRLQPENVHAAPQDNLNGNRITIRDVEHEIRVEHGRGIPVHIRDMPAPMLIVRGEPAHMQRRIQDFLKREARDDLERASRRYADAMQLEYSRVSVRDTTSRWGSCSSTGTLSYSWRLVMAPARVLDYVCAHEVAHLAEMNHGPDFWDLVYRHCPHTDFARKWLRKNGSRLHSLPV